MGSSGVLDIVVRAETDAAQAKMDQLAQTIQQKIAQEGIAAFDTFAEQSERAFAGIEVEAGKRMAGVERAFDSLGVMSGRSFESQAAAIVAAFERIKDASGELAGDDVARAKTAMEARLEALKKRYEEIGGAAKSGLGQAEQASQQLDGAMSRLGVQSSAQVKARIQGIIADYRTLKDSGVLSAQQLNTAHGNMVAAITKVTNSYRNAKAGQEGHTTAVTRGQAALGNMRGSLSELVSTYVSLYAAQRVFTSIITAYRDADKAAFNLKSSVASANREFSNTGTLEDWQSRLSRLHEELQVVSESDLSAAAAKTIDMTKRLGFSADQMEEVIRRTADLSAGKMDLSDGIERVTAAMRGEAEASEMLGLTLSETYVKGWHEAHNAQGKAWASLTDMEKAQVRFQVFLQQTASNTGKAAESINTFDGALRAIGASLSDSVAKNENLQGALKELAEYFRDNRQEIAEFSAVIVNAVASVIKFAVHNKELVLALAGLLAAAKTVTVLTDAFLGLVYAGRILKELKLASTVAGWLSKFPEVAAGLARVVTGAKTAAAAIMALGSGPVAAILALVAAATGAGLAIAKLSKEQAAAKKIWDQAADTQEKADAAIREYARSLGYVVADEADFRQRVTEGSIDLKKKTAATQGLSSANKALGESYQDIGERGKANLERVGEAYDFAAKQAKALAATESEGAARAVAINEEKHRTLTTLAKSIAADQIAAINSSSAEESAKADQTAGVHKQLKETLKGLLQERIKDLRSALDEAISEEKRYAQVVRDSEKSTADLLRDIRREGMDSTQKYYDIKKQGAELAAEAEKQLALGTKEGIDNAIKLATEGQSVAKSMVSAGKEAVGLNTAMADASSLASRLGEVLQKAGTEGMKQSHQDVETLIEKLQQANKEMAELEKKSLNILISVDAKSVTEAKAAIDALDGKKTESTHGVTDNTADVLAAINRLNGHDTSSTHTVYKREVSTYATGGGVPRDVPAMVMPGERVFDPDTAARYAPLLRAVNALQIPAYATGGLVFRPFIRGMVPGVGDEDSEPVMLKEGSFVVRKAAVARHGALLDAIQAGGVRGYASGGFVLPDWVNRLYQPCFATLPADPVAPTPLSVSLAVPAAFRAMTTPVAGPAGGMTSRGAAAVSRLDGLRQSGALKFASGGSLDETLADIALERRRTQQDYDEAVSDAKASHDDGLAALLAQERDDLDAIAATLADALAQLQAALAEAQTAYATALAEADAAKKEADAAAQTSYAESAAEEKAEWEEKKAELAAAVKEAQDAYAAWKKKGQDEKPGYGVSTFSASNGLVHNSSRTKQVVWKDYSESGQKALADYEAEGKDLRQAVAAAQKELASLGNFRVSDDTTEALADALAEAKTELAASKSSALSEYQSAVAEDAAGKAEATTQAAADTATAQDQAKADAAELDKEMADTLAGLKKDFDRAMEDLAIEEARARANADEEKGYTVSGFSQWLRDGGPVSLANLRRYAAGGFVGAPGLLGRLARFAGGGEVPAVPGSVAGQDSVLAALTPGEGVINPQAMGRLISGRALAALNNLDYLDFLDELPRYRDGGVVGGAKAAKEAVAGLSSVASGDGGGQSYTATLNLNVGGKTFQARAKNDVARDLAATLRRHGVNVK
jgi:hypothetical protein